jgi:cell division protease FtsH
MKNLVLGAVLGFGAAIVLMITLSSVSSTPRFRLLTDYSRFVADVDEGKVEEVTIGGSSIAAMLKDGKMLETAVPHAQLVPALTDRLLAKGVRVKARPPLDEDTPTLVSILINWTPFILVWGAFLTIVWLSIARPLWALARQIEAYTQSMQARSSEQPRSMP